MNMKIILHLSLIILLANGAPLHAGDVPLDAKTSSLNFTGHAFMDDFTGQAVLMHGSAQIDPQSTQIVTGAKIIISAASMTTFENTRDKNMRSWLEVETNPEIVFVLKNVTQTQAMPAALAATKVNPATFSVQGDLTLHRATHPIDTQAFGWREGPWLVVTGTMNINTDDYGLPQLQLFFMKVEKKVNIAFHLAFTLPPELRLGAAAKTEDTL